MWINQSGVVFTTHTDIRLALPGVSLPEVITDADLAACGLAPVLPVAVPAFDAATQAAELAAPVNAGGVWLQVWRVRPLSSEEALAAAAQARSQAKAARSAAVAAIKVTTQAGNTFDGDETSQTRMARAIIALSTGLAPSVPWILANNSVMQATPAELTEALVLAGQAQSALWVA